MLNTLLPALSKEENHALLILALNNPDNTEARDSFFAHNMRLIWHTAHKFINTNYDLDELFGYGQLGFMKAYKTFDPSKEIQFATYATRCMENEILMFLRRNKKHMVSGDTFSLDHIIANNDLDGSELRLEDVVDDGTNFAEGHATKNHLRHVLQAFQAKETPRNFDILMMYFNEEMLQEDIAQHYNLSQSFVSRIIKRSVQKLQKLERKCV